MPFWQRCQQGRDDSKQVRILSWGFGPRFWGPLNHRRRGECLTWQQANRTEDAAVRLQTDKSLEHEKLNHDSRPERACRLVFRETVPNCKELIIGG